MQNFLRIQAALGKCVMRLTQIKLAGFKSFTDPTTIHVPGKLVAVIGPNGCGKSNVIDAVRWVLGEASAKQLRGESMQDVIFNGAATRKPAPRASVELVFDNSDFALQGAWGKFAEVSIKRQLTRQGESTYFINNQVVRRRDITDLFLGTGVGARGYAVIEQGMISRIIEARPEELRAYLEEAAGVSKYKERRRETEARLKDSNEHLQRLADVQTELARQIEKLEKQATTANRYHDLHATLTQKQNQLHYLQWQQALNQADLAKAEHEKALQQQQELEQKNQEINQQLTTLRQDEQEAQQQHHSLNQEYALLREQTARLEEQIRAYQAQQQRLQREQEQAEYQLSQLAQQQQDLQSEQALINEDIAQKQQTLEEWRIQLAEHELMLPEYEEKQHDIQAALTHQQETLNRLKREYALKEQRAQHHQQSIAQLAARQQRLSVEKTAFALPNQQEVASAQKEAEQLKNQYDQSEQLLKQSEQTQQDLRKQVQAADEEHRQLHTQLLTLQAEQHALEQLLQHQTENDFWANSEYANTPSVWQQIHVPDEWQQALSVVLAERLYARKLPENSDFMPQNTANIAWINHSGSLSQKHQPAQALIHQIQVNKAIQAAVFYWLDGVLCAPNLAYALENQHTLQAQQIWLTPEGHRVDKHSVTLFDPQSQNQLLQHKNRYEQLTQEIQELTPKAQQSKQNFQAAQNAWQQHQDAQLAAQTEHRQLANQWQQASQLANELLTKINQSQLRHQHITNELQLIEEEQETLQQQAESLLSDADELQQSINELNAQHNQLSGSLNDATQRLKNAQLAHLEANRQCNLAELALHKQQQQLQALQQQFTLLQQQEQHWQEKQTQLDFHELDQDNQEEQYIKLEEFNALSEQIQNQIQAAAERINSIQQQGRAAFEAQQQLTQQQPNIQAAIQDALLQQQEALLHAKHFHEQLQEAQADLNQLALSNEQAHDLNQQINQLTQKIQSLGSVNLAALEELTEAQQRNDYYQQQSQDVQAAIALLQDAIAQIDDETKNRFQETFNTVNQKMQTFFPTLFGGGEATLHLTDDDLLNAGVSIMARPPGKKNSTIHLLSGGEKALTAMSLVFALFALNPAPFCLLDEVDAPLDDANTSRFCQLVKEMSQQTQFLYISHNRLTMEMAEQLVGVTMQEKGVSRIVAVDIQKALQMAENNKENRH